MRHTPEEETYNEQVPVCATVLIPLLCVVIVADLDASTDTEFKHIEYEIRRRRGGKCWVRINPQEVTLHFSISRDMICT
jgi:hypothetical protein